MTIPDGPFRVNCSGPLGYLVKIDEWPSPLPIALAALIQNGIITADQLTERGWVVWGGAQADGVTISDLAETLQRLQ